MAWDGIEKIKNKLSRKDRKKAQEIDVKIKNLNENESKEIKEELSEEESKIVEIVESENNMIRKLQEKIEETDKKLLKTDISKIISQDDDELSMTFSYLKQDLYYIVMYTEDIEKMCLDALTIEEKIKKILRGHLTREEINKLKLFKNEEENIHKYLEKIGKKAKELHREVKILGSAEDGEEKNKEEIAQIEESVEIVFKSFYSLMKNLNKLGIEFNHAIKTVRELLAYNNILELELSKHVYFLEHGSWVMPAGEENKELTKRIEEHEKEWKKRPQYLYDGNSGVSQKEYDKTMEESTRNGRKILKASKKKIREIEHAKKKSA